MNLRLDPHNAILPALAMLCAAVTVCAQDYGIAQNSLPVVTNPKQLAALVLVQTVPEYPPVAKVNYLEGPVQIAITVDKKGNVSSAHVLNGNPILAAAALKAVHRWVYHPLNSKGEPAGFMTTVKLKFSLHRQQIELTPRQAEQDFQRQVKPPQIESPANETQPAEVVHMRLLVNDQGQVIDTDASRLDNAHFKAVSEELRAWTFHPAHWGTMPIAAYLNVDVPVGALFADRTARNSEAH